MDSKKKIIKSAIEEFSQHYYDQASVNRIIKDSGTSKGTFYHYFDSKKALYLEIIDDAMMKKLDFINSNMKNMSERIQQNTLFENLHLLTKLGFEFAMQYPELSQMGFKMLEEPNRNIYDEIASKSTSQTESFFRPLVEQSWNNGELNKSLTKDFILKTVTFLINNYPKMNLESDNISEEQIVRTLDQLYEFIKNGMASNDYSEKFE